MHETLGQSKSSIPEIVNINNLEYKGDRMEIRFLQDTDDRMAISMYL